MSKTLYILGAVLIAGFAVLGVLEMQKSVTPYVTSVAQARAGAQGPIQFMGEIVPGRMRYDREAREFVFQLRDNEGDTMTVRYDGPRSMNIEGVDKVVVVGSYRAGAFVATDLMTKCPSKYESR